MYCRTSMTYALLNRVKRGPKNISKNILTPFPEGLWHKLGIFCALPSKQHVKVYYDY
jgi:hypothetical protein